MTSLAAATTTGRRDPITMPFALGPLPSRLAPEAIMLARGQRCIGYGFGQQPGQREWVGSVMTACRVPTGRTRATTIHAADGIVESEAASVAVHDFSDGTSVVVEVDDGQQRYVSAADGQRLAADADVTPELNRPSTWITVR